MNASKEERRVRALRAWRLAALCAGGALVLVLIGLCVRDALVYAQVGRFGSAPLWAYGLARLAVFGPAALLSFGIAAFLDRRARRKR